MIDLIPCPNCKERVVWRFVYPRNRKDFCCQKCGHTWVDAPEAIQSQFGTFLGPWAGQEMTKLEENIEALTPDVDWSFFKGRNIWTAWQTAAPELLIRSKTVDELIYWVALATQSQDNKWYDAYNKLSCDALPQVGTGDT